MFSLTVLFSLGRKKEWKSSALPAWGMVTYPAAWVLYHWECICYLLGTDTEKADCSCTFKLHLTCSEGFGLQKASLCIILHCKANTLHCSLWLPWGWGVKTGKRDNGYTCGGLWALQWPPCLLTLPSLSHKSYPERFIWLSCQASPGAFGGWSCSTPKPHGDKFFICWVTTVRGRLCCTTQQGSCGKCHNKSVIRMIIPPAWSRGRGWEEAHWHEDSDRKVCGIEQMFVHGKPGPACISKVMSVCVQGNVSARLNPVLTAPLPLWVALDFHRFHSCSQQCTPLHLKSLKRSEAPKLPRQLIRPDCGDQEKERAIENTATSTLIKCYAILYWNPLP